MAHGPQPHTSLPAAPGPGHHASAEDEYLFQPKGAAHEHSDANVWIIIKFGLWLAVSAVVVSAGMGLLFGLFVSRSAETTPEFPLATGQEHRLPAPPRLQQFPLNEAYEFRQHEQAVLEKYGWVNKEAGVVRMPIAEAMTLTVERGLPTRAEQPPADQAAPQPSAQAPGQLPADSSAGRTMERRRQ